MGRRGEGGGDGPRVRRARMYRVGGSWRKGDVNFEDMLGGVEGGREWERQRWVG